MYRIVTLALLIFSQPASSTAIIVDDVFEGFAATGLSPGGLAGSLDSTRWAIAGASDGDTWFGDTRDRGDFARGLSSGGVGSGGVYAFLLPGDEVGLGVQPTGGDFTPGRITRRVVNETGGALRDLALELDLWFLNDGSRSTRVGAAYATSTPGAWSPLASLQLDTPGASDDLGWQHRSLLAPLPVELLGGGETLFLSLLFDDLAGSGSRDELALSALRLTGVNAAPTSLASPGSRALGLLAVALAALCHAAGSCRARGRSRKPAS